MSKSNAAVEVLREGQNAAAKQITLFRLFWLFLLSSFLGDLIEVVFWAVTRGELVSRSSLLWGPFSLVWGLGAVVLTLALHPLQGQNNLVVFFAGSLLGGGYEYLCSWFQEWAFGAYFWDYSHLPFNLNGRINLVFCLLWGLAAVAWVRVVLPGFIVWIDRIQRGRTRVLTGLLAAFLLVSTAVSAAALIRMHQRQEAIPASNPVQVFLDERFPDQRLQDRYPYMGLTGGR
ncbi:MAG TPA: putative ABC transporter permease [Candidatus Enterenecus stercoripullorum]|nr:putative ABC transporter permease [Candidatus Enterenecus stercoripullorum]